MLNIKSLINKIGTVFNVVLSDMIKTVTFYQSNQTDDTGDLYYKENTQFYKNISGTEVKTNTLSKLIHENNLPTPDYIKIDTQGVELDIL